MGKGLGRFVGFLFSCSQKHILFDLHKVFSFYFQLKPVNFHPKKLKQKHSVIKTILRKWEYKTAAGDIQHIWNLPVYCTGRKKKAIKK